MRIIVNNTAASSGGAMSILKSFYDFIKNDEKAQEFEWIFLLNDKYISETDNIKVRILPEVKKNWFERLKFDIYTGKKLLQSMEPDIVVSFQNTITFGLNKPQILYMHQSIPFQKEKKFSLFKAPERKLAVYQYFIGWFIKQSIKYANHTVVQTNWIEKAVLEQTKISQKKITSIMPPIKKSNINDDGNKQLEKNTFFYPANGAIYKNHEIIFKAIKILNDRGYKNFQVFLTLEQNGNDDHNIIYTGYLDHSTIMNYYKKTTLVFPSYIETIGLPLLEAKECGTMILASETDFSHEALLNYNNAYYFNPFNAEELASLMEGVIVGNIVKEKTRLESNKEDSWSQFIEVILNESNCK